MTTILKYREYPLKPFLQKSPVSTGLLVPILPIIWYKNHKIFGLDIHQPDKEGVERIFGWDELGKVSPVDAIVHLAGKAHDTKNRKNDHHPPHIHVEKERSTAKFLLINAELVKSRRFNAHAKLLITI